MTNTVKLGLPQVFRRLVDCSLLLLRKVTDSKICAIYPCVKFLFLFVVIRRWHWWRWGGGGGCWVYVSPCSLAVVGIGLHLGMTMRMGGIHIFDLDFYFTVHQPCKFE